MNIDSFNIIVLVSFYIIGSLPFALIVHRLLSTDDPRTSGSNNPGATNMYRVAGPIAGFLTFLGDFLKGFLPIYLLTFNEPLNAYLYSLVILLGHMFSVFNNFKGGKGVATSFGFLLAIDYQIGFTIILVWIIIFLLKKISGLSAIISFLSLPLIAYFFSSDYWIILITTVHSIVILTNHKKNIIDLLDS